MHPAARRWTRGSLPPLGRCEGAAVTTAHVSPWTGVCVSPGRVPGSAVSGLRNCLIV